MNQLACPTDISSGVGGCAKMCLEKGDAGARSKVGRAVGVNPNRRESNSFWRFGVVRMYVWVATDPEWSRGS